MFVLHYVSQELHIVFFNLLLLNVITMLFMAR